MIGFRAGDIFSFALPDGLWMFGRVLLDVKRQCIEPRLLEMGSPLSSFNGMMLVEIYSQTAPSQDFSEEEIEVLIPGIFIGADLLEDGDAAIVGHRPVDPAEVEFPEGFMGGGPLPRFIRGELDLPVDLASLELQEEEPRVKRYPSGILDQLCLVRLGRGEELGRPANLLKLVDVAASDMRYSDLRCRLYELLGEDEHASYYDLSRRKGLDLSRFYPGAEERKNVIPEEGGESRLVGCPYCMEPKGQDAAFCPNCGEDTTHDPGFEYSQQEHALEERTACSVCGKPKIKLAIICPHCRKRRGA